ncbi:Succinate-semialdehyde dehydrogenase [NAD]; Succinate-semialdehyde dehydrogenase [NAD(P)+] [Micrococcus lylae]|uniref:Succinate-semialdehyde dehydrogenase [NAD] Succinate-semialdehyde dehydrogenase [NAD(P)+] n=1 Tax=Micrococcus lylae TaxID=1273 RepID=A0A1R4J204_9MICC|nr:NAD-dependent succinate-semialdehyde dehydrogenase [Micrococcus lylae]SJN26087.1 Succinate-semialdehyde dehydrogenase [NAD]; Succinate-semialdehyde dehydrogenase [NAD(P)+] [Micrococcus lylae]
MSTATGYRVHNPATDEVVETFDSLQDSEIDGVLATAVAGQREWAALSVDERGTIVQKVADLFDERKHELAQIIAEEMGKRVSEGVEEAEFSAEIFGYFVKNAAELSKDRPIESFAGGRAMVRSLPIGVLLGIMPWNFPYYQIARFAAPNLMLGNAIVLKHAEICPRSALAVQKIMDDAGVPAGVYTNVFATHDQISEFIADPRIQGVSLTGSERAGAIIGAQAGQHLKKAVLELGGSDPYVILDTEDVAEAAATAWGTRMYNQGQACNSNKRMIVAEDIYDEFVAELVKLASAMKPGEPASEDETVYLPLSSRGAAETLAEQVAKAREQGATVHVGGELGDGAGALFSPAVITDVTKDMDAYSEELFGPVAVVYKASSPEEALELANDTPFGLGGAVFSQDEALAEKIASQLEVGMANVNTPAGEGAEIPFGGVKRSGFGRELGPLGMDEFVNKQMYYVQP